jgi:hypothetical protein
MPKGEYGVVVNSVFIPIKTKADEKQDENIAVTAGELRQEIQAREAGDAAAVETARVYADAAILDRTANYLLDGAYLAQVIGGVTVVPKTLFDASAPPMVPGRSFVHDKRGSVGIYISDADSANISVTTITISYVGRDEPALLGNIYTDNGSAGLPQTVADGETAFKRTPVTGDHAKTIDSKQQVIEWYVVVNEDGSLTWGDEIVINTSDYQAQTTAQDAGKLLIGGATPGTYGTSVPIDPTPTPGSNNPVSSGGVAVALANVGFFNPYAWPVGEVQDLGNGVMGLYLLGTITAAAGANVRTLLIAKDMAPYTMIISGGEIGYPSTGVNVMNVAVNSKYSLSKDGSSNLESAIAFNSNSNYPVGDSIVNGIELNSTCDRARNNMPYNTWILFTKKS